MDIKFPQSVRILEEHCETYSTTPVVIKALSKTASLTLIASPRQERVYKYQLVLQHG